MVLSYTIEIDSPSYRFRPPMDVGGYSKMAINWLSFESPIDKKVLFLTIEELTNKKWYLSSGVVTPYTVSMPIKQDALTTYSSSDSHKNEIPLDRRSIKTLTFHAFYEGGNLGTEDATFVTSANKVLLELEFE